MWYNIIHKLYIMKDYINNSYNKSINEQKEFYLYDIPIFLLEKLPPNININNIINNIKDLIPYEMYSNLEGIYIGDFKELKDRQVQAIFKDGVIYLSSYKDFPDIDEETITSHIIHEIAHLLEDNFYNEIYGDHNVELEYISKKKKLVELLKSNGVSFHGLGKLFFSDEYISKLDNFLHKEVGYENLIGLTIGLFTSPYSVTTLREYFANGFEEYFLGDYNYLEEISPRLFKKIDDLVSSFEE